MKPFIHEDFLLQNEQARSLYHDYAKGLPIIDYHCHLEPQRIADDYVFKDITEAWLAGDHYKWRAMRANGIDERYITGNASGRDKFKAWARTVPYTLRNPLYHWTHMELKAYFGVDELLNEHNADKVFDHCNTQLKRHDMSVQGLLHHMKVEVVCSTDDPIHDLRYHAAHAAATGSPQLFPTFRPDALFAIEDGERFRKYVERLGQAADLEIRSYKDLLEALNQRLDHFHAHGCRLSDHGFERIFSGGYHEGEATTTFDVLLSGKTTSADAVEHYRTALLFWLCCQYAERGWTQQFHLGALRNTNTRKLRELGPDTGYDSMGDFSQAKPLQALLNRLEEAGCLAQTILYNLNPADNELFATMVGNFNDGSLPGKMQYGSAWWFLDQKEGMERQLNALSNMGLLSRFVGMLTDSRSFLSFPRHDYFRRVLCNLLGQDMAQGLLPDDFGLIGGLVQDISYRNAKEYFKFQPQKSNILHES